MLSNRFKKHLLIWWRLPELPCTSVPGFQSESRCRSTVRECYNDGTGWWWGGVGSYSDCTYVFWAWQPTGDIRRFNIATSCITGAVRAAIGIDGGVQVEYIWKYSCSSFSKWFWLTHLTLLHAYHGPLLLYLIWSSFTACCCLLCFADWLHFRYWYLFPSRDSGSFLVINMGSSLFLPEVFVSRSNFVSKYVYLSLYLWWFSGTPTFVFRPLIIPSTCTSLLLQLRFVWSLATVPLC